ncbi:MAG: hypothetical protein HY914_20065 [Desulfomonile tiedjei]|nr:hypothetical protein [Desulfomonile tiedjei]
MRKGLLVFAVLLGLVAYFGMATQAADETIKKGDFVTVCKPGTDCGKVETASKDPKACKCGAASEQLHVLKVEGDVVVLCQCGGGCACDLNAKNPYLCGCGTPVKTARLVK